MPGQQQILAVRTVAKQAGDCSSLDFKYELTCYLTSLKRMMRGAAGTSE